LIRGLGNEKKILDRGKSAVEHTIFIVVEFNRTAIIKINSYNTPITNKKTAPKPGAVSIHQRMD